jgi:hypothetical protein
MEFVEKSQRLARLGRPLRYHLIVKTLKSLLDLAIGYKTERIDKGILNIGRRIDLNGNITSQ